MQKTMTYEAVATGNVITPAIINITVTALGIGRFTKHRSSSLEVICKKAELKIAKFT